METTPDAAPATSWNDTLDATSSDDDLAVLNEDDEAAAWLSDVGLASLIDGIFSGEQLTDDFLEAAIEQRHLTKHQVNTVRRRVDTLRKTLKKRRSSRSGPAPPRRDCRDIFANVDPPTPSRDDALLTPPSSLEAAAAAAAAAAAVGPGVAGDHSVGSSGRSRSATPDSMHGSPCQDRSSNENLLDPTAWTKAEHVRRDLTSDEDDFSVKPELSVDQTPLALAPCAVDGPFEQDQRLSPAGWITDGSQAEMQLRRRTSQDQMKATLVVESSRQRRSSWNLMLQTKNVIKTPSRPGIFRPTSHVASVDIQSVQMVRFEQVGTRRRSDPVSPTVGSLVRSPDELSGADLVRVQQLALLEVTTLFDQLGLVMARRKRQSRQNRFRDRVRAGAGGGVKTVGRRRSDANAYVFGVPLAKLVKRDRKHGCRDTGVPVILTMLMDVLRSQHLEEEGLLRIPGNQQKVNQLQKEIESHCKGDPVYWTNSVRAVLEQSSAHDVAALFKLLLRKLPDPLFTTEYVDVFSQVTDVRPAEEQVRALNYLLLLLPAENRQTLHQLMRLLASVAEHEASNRMSEQALATVLGPNLFPPRVLKGGARKNKLTDIQEGLAYTAKCNRVTELLLLHQNELFLLPAKLYDQLSLTKCYI